MDNRHEQLVVLNARLGELVSILALDPPCQWHKHFIACQQETSTLLRDGFTQDALNQLSGSVMHVFGGSGSFNDYAPVTTYQDGTFQVVAGMEGVGELAGNVYDAALALRVIRHAP
jgi:hypothetical protein